jgi:CheY-like chemotaxis protein
VSTWMVVEDEPSIYEVLLMFIEFWGIEGIAFVDGDEALAWIEKVDSGAYRGELPELALLDLRLPTAIGGSDISARMRQSPLLKDTAIVLTSAYRLSQREHQSLMSAAQADGYLAKPFPKIAELKAMLETHIQQRRQPPHASAQAAPPFTTPSTQEDNPHA